MLEMATNRSNSKYDGLTNFDFMVYLLLKSNETLCWDIEEVCEIFDIDAPTNFVWEIPFVDGAFDYVYSMIYRKNKRSEHIKKIHDSIEKLLEYELLYCYIKGVGPTYKNQGYRMVRGKDGQYKLSDIILYAVTEAGEGQNYIQVSPKHINKLMKKMNETSQKDKAYYIFLFCCVHLYLKSPMEPLVNQKNKCCFLQNSIATIFTTRSDTSENRTKVVLIAEIFSTVGLTYISWSHMLKHRKNPCTIQYFGFCSETELYNFIEFNCKTDKFINVFGNPADHEIMRIQAARQGYTEEDWPTEDIIDDAIDDYEFSPEDFEFDDSDLPF